LGAALATWQLAEISSKELDERKSLGFPPTARVASATGSKPLLESLRQLVSVIPQVRILGLAESEATGDSRSEYRLIFSFSYASTEQVVETVNSFILKASGQVRTSTSGRNRRPVTIKLDDSRVL
jgi:hypothetical protein